MKSSKNDAGWKGGDGDWMDGRDWMDGWSWMSGGD